MNPALALGVSGLGICLAGGAARSDEEAFTALCRHKMHRIYAATMMFVKANAGYLPPAYIDARWRRPIAGHGAWHALLAPHLERMGERTLGTYVSQRKQPHNTIFHCPANPYWYGGYGPGCIGYAWNSHLGMLHAKLEPSAVTLVRFEDVLDKARTILMTGAGAVSGHGPYAWYHARSRSQVGYWHAGKANVLFLDGHVETLAPKDIEDRWFQVRLRPAATRPSHQRKETE